MDDGDWAAVASSALDPDRATGRRRQSFWDCTGTPRPPRSFVIRTVWNHSGTLRVRLRVRKPSVFMVNWGRETCGLGLVLGLHSLTCRGPSAGIIRRSGRNNSWTSKIPDIIEEATTKLPFLPGKYQDLLRDHSLKQAQPNNFYFNLR